MNRLMQLVIICLSSLFMMSAQAGDIPTKICVIFADDGSKQDGEKPAEDSEEEEEEPDCD